jgi:hypothetical protein
MKSPMGFIDTNTAIPKFSGIKKDDILLKHIFVTDDALQLNLDNPDTIWEFEAPQSNLIRYYGHSLRYLRPIIDEFDVSNDKNLFMFADSIVGSFLDFIEDKNERFWYNSEDHAIFIRSILLLECLRVFPQDWDKRLRIEQLFQKQILWMTTEKSWHKSNHGLMTDYGLLHMSVYFSDEKLQNNALKRIIRLLEFSFDEDGFCNENTPQYAQFNLTLYQAVINFCKHYGIETEAIGAINLGIAKGYKALAYLVKQDNSIPPIGDSGYASLAVGNSINESKYFRNANFAVLKDANLYLTLKSGWSSSTHKHADEGAIVLSYKNEDIFVDSGMFNYDYSNSKRLYVRSTAGHSSFFPIPFDELAVSEYLAKINQNAAIDYYSSDAYQAYLISHYAYDDEKSNVKRTIARNENEIIISDEYVLAKKAPMRQRFCLSPTATAQILSDNSFMRKIKISKGDFNVFLHVFSLNAKFNTEINSGIVSFRNNQVIENLLVDSIIESSAKGALHCCINLNFDASLFGKIIQMSYFQRFHEVQDDALAKARDLMRNRAVLQSGTTFDVTENIFNMASFDSAPRTNYLYLYSLQWLSPLIYAYEIDKNPEYLVKIDCIIGQFFKYLLKPSRSEHLIDHSIYVRSCVFIHALMVAPQDWAHRDSVVALLYAQGIWAYNDINHADNNHGIMTDFGLLHLSQLFGDYMFAGDWKKKAISRINDMLGRHFDIDGFNDENSMFYFRYNIDLYTIHIARFCAMYSIHDIEMLDKTLELSKKSFADILWFDGGYPPIGDSDVGINAGIPTNISRCFNEAGFAVIKGHGAYLSFKCGWSHTAHKHMDDASITLRYRDVDLICDSGRYNYDINHPIRQYCVSTDAHSGIYPYQSSSWTIKEYTSRISDAKITSFDETPTGTVAKCKYRFDRDSVYVTRTLMFGNTNKLTIIDTYSSNTPIRMRINFVLHPDTLTVGNSGDETVDYRLFKNGDTFMRIDTSSSDVRFNCYEDIGYYCPDYQVHHKTSVHSIVTDESYSGTIVTHILWGDDDENFAIKRNIETTEYRVKWSGVDVDGMQHDEKFGTRIHVLIDKGNLIADVTCDYKDSPLQFAYYLYKNNNQEPIQRVGYVNKNRHVFALKDKGVYSVKFFVKRQEDHYSHSDSFFSKSVVYNNQSHTAPHLTLVPPSKSRQLIITIDTEALPKRADSDFINRLIYGKIDGDVYGIGRFMDIADKFSVKLTFFLELAETDLYGDELIKVGKYIISRGHDLQLHMHPDMFEAAFLEENFKDSQNVSILNALQSKAVVARIMEQWHKITPNHPKAYRGGGYYIGMDMLNALCAAGVMLDLSYNSNRPQKLPQASPFIWANGVCEIPITIVPTGKWVGKELNFNSSYVFPQADTRTEFFTKANNLIDFLSNWYGHYGNDKIATLVMHSWSFQRGKKEPHYDNPVKYAPQWFEYLLDRLVKKIDIITASDVDTTTKKYSILDGFAFTNIQGCNICGNEEFAVFNSKFPRKCTKCSSLERTRTLCTLIDTLPCLLLDKKVLHISAANAETTVLKKYTALITSIDVRTECNADITGDICNMPQVADKSFDVVLANCVLNHVYDDSAACSEIYRVLNDSGKFIVWVMDSGRDETINHSDPTGWYGKDNFEKYNIGTFRNYGKSDFLNLLKKYFSDVAVYPIYDNPSGQLLTWYVCTKQ